MMAVHILACADRSAFVEDAVSIGDVCLIEWGVA